TDPWKKVLAAGAAEATVVQPHVSKVIKELAEAKTPLRMLDTFKKTSFFTRKPDICICPVEHAATLPAPWYIIAIGDVKGRRSGSEGFGNDEIGKIILFLIDLLRTRPDRPAATGFLTDSYVIQFIRLRVSSSAAFGFEADVTRPFVLKRVAVTGTEPCGGDW